VRVIRSCRVARWLETGEIHHPGSEGQYEPLISFQPTSLDHFANSGFLSLENLVFHDVLSCEEQGKEIQTIGSKSQENRWIRTFAGYRVSVVRGLKELLFDCRSHKVSSAKGSYECCGRMET
jgi:hypothetical protein